MTQTLELEAAWEKQVSQQDRQLIEQSFQEVEHSTGIGISYTYLRHDFNHRGELLVMVLIHNYEKNTIAFKERQLICCDHEGNRLAKEVFSLPVDLPAQTSMPWTFIFPQDSHLHAIKDIAALMIQDVTSVK